MLLRLLLLIYCHHRSCRYFAGRSFFLFEMLVYHLKWFVHVLVEESLVGDGDVVLIKLLLIFKLASNLVGHDCLRNACLWRATHRLATIVLFVAELVWFLPEVVRVDVCLWR